MRYLRCLWILSLLFLIACGSADVGPDAVDEWANRHPNEIKIYDYTQCYAEFAGRGKYKVVIQEEAKMYPCPPPHKGECPGKGWAFPDSRYVTYWGPWVRGEYNGPRTDWALSIVAAHEVGHTTGIWDETRAELWAVNAYLMSNCND